MKVLILSTIYPRGPKELEGNKVHGKFVHALAKAWHKNGAEVHVITPQSIQTKSNEILDGINVHRFHYFFNNKLETLTYGDGIPENIKKFKNKLLVPFLTLAFFFNSFFLIRKYRINTINAHWIIPAGFIGVFLKFLTRKTLVTTAYGAELFPIINGKMKVLKPFLGFTIKKSDIVAGISQETVSVAKEIGSREDIHVIPDGIDLEYYKPAPKNLPILKKYNCENKKVIYLSGRMVERKGHKYLLESMKAVIEKFPNSKLILGGKGPMFDELLKLKEELNLDKYVELPGFIPEDEMVPLLQSADLFVLPSCIDKNGDTEGSATAALEAMACGTPAIIAKVGGNINSIVDGFGAYYFESKNHVDLSTKILTFLSLKDTAEISLNAREHIKQNYSWQKMVEKYEKLINDY